MARLPKPPKPLKQKKRTINLVLDSEVDAELIEIVRKHQGIRFKPGVIRLAIDYALSRPEEFEDYIKGVLTPVKTTANLEKSIGLG